MKKLIGWILFLPPFLLIFGTFAFVIYQETTWQGWIACFMFIGFFIGLKLIEL